MAPETVGSWEEYRRMVVDWHTSEVTARKEAKEALEKYQESNRLEHQEIMEKLGKLVVEKEQARRWSGPVMAAAIAAAVTGAAKAFGW
jgi:trehalose-6-phosphatase